jgi:predicted phage tail protein
MKTLKLTGRLAKKFGKEFHLDVESPAEAIRALCYQIPGFEEALKEGSYRVKRLVTPSYGFDIGIEAVHLNFGKSPGFILSPVVKGSKKQGIGKIILGIVLVGAAFFFSGGLAAGAIANGAMAATIGSTGITYGYLASMGAMMMLNGISRMLTPSVKNPGPSDQKASYMLDATGNVTEQGNAVPIVIGEVFTGSVVVSTGITTEEVPVS